MLLSVGRGPDEVTLEELPDGTRDLHVGLTRLTASPRMPENAWITFTAGVRQLISDRFRSR
jgi:hypothetical protein